MFLKILQVSQENTCVGVSFLQAKFSRTPSFTEHGDVLLWFLQQSNLIFRVITITLGYNQKSSWRYCHYYHIPYIKISIYCQKYAHLVQKFYSLSQQSPNFMILSSIYFCITSIFLKLYYLLSPPLPTELSGYVSAKLSFFYKNVYVITKTKNDLERPETI